MSPKSCRGARLWLVALLLALGSLFGLNAVYGQPGRIRPIMPPTTQPQNPGGLPGGITPIGPGFPQGAGAPQPAVPGQGTLPNPGFPGQPNPGFPGVTPPNPGFPGNPGFPANGGQRQTGTCTCSNCKATFPVYDNVNPTGCPRCGAKFDIVIGGNPFNPQPGIGSQPPIPTPPPLNPPGFPSSSSGGPQLVPRDFQPRDPVTVSRPSTNSASADDADFSDDFTPLLVICATVGIILLGVFIVLGIVVFVMIIQRIQAADAAAPRRRRPLRRRRNFDA
jgi:hypothetical protein